MLFKKKSKSNKPTSNLSKYVGNFLAAGGVASIPSYFGVSNNEINLINFSIATISSKLLIATSLNDSNIIEKELCNLESFIKEIRNIQNDHSISNLQRFTNFDLSTDEYNTFLDVIHEGIYAKSKYIRRLIAILIINFGREHSSFSEVKEAFEIIKQLSENDSRLLLYFTYKYVIESSVYSESESEKKQKRLESEFKPFHDEFLNDHLIYARHIYTSSIKLESLGLVERACSYKPQDEVFYDSQVDRVNTNKKALLDNFLYLNFDEGERTVIFDKFIQSITVLDL